MNASEQNRLQLRRKRYFRLSSDIAQMDNAQLRSLFDEGEASGGRHSKHTVEIGQQKVFVKRVPVTNIEYDNMFSTRNLYDLPTYYNYGVGSAGMGVFRELVAHIKTTNWVLDGAIATFPLTYHYRIIPFSGARENAVTEYIKGYVEYWGNSANVGRYALDRETASYELILFLEHMPYTVQEWLIDHPNRVGRVLDDLRETLAFLRKHGIIHFDAHLWNAVTDGKQVYMTDFGLVLDKSFQLTDEEQAFFRKHTYYDCGEVLSSLSHLVAWFYKASPEDDQRRIRERYSLKDDVQHNELVSVLLNNFEEIDKLRMMKLDREYVSCILKYRSIISLMNDFYSEMWSNHKKDTKFRHATLRLLLKATGFLPGTGSNG